MKFLEVVGAGAATAITGYLIAHLGWFSPAPRPAAVETLPSVTTVTKAPRVQPAAADTGAHPAASSRKASAELRIESKRDPDDQTHDADSVADQIRAALAKVDANRPRPAEIAPHQVEVTPALPAAAVPPRQVEVTPALPAAATPRTVEPPAGAIAAVPPAAETAPPPATPEPVAPAPLGIVEIKSQPVADVAAMPAAPPAATADAQDDKSLLSALKKIPEMLRPKSAATTDPPRPPLPVGDPQRD